MRNTHNLSLRPPQSPSCMEGKYLKLIMLFLSFHMLQLFQPYDAIFLKNAEAQIAKETEVIEMVIVMDRSGSMKTRDPEGLSIPSAAFILDQLSLMNEQNQASVVLFSSNVSIIGQTTNTPQGSLTSNIAGLIEMMNAGQSHGNFTFQENAPEEPAKLLTLLRTQINEKGYTELDPALKLALSILESGKEHRRKIIVLISDGVPEVYHNDAGRMDELGVFANLKLINRVKKKTNLNKDLPLLNKQYSNYILETTAVKIRDKNITILPIAFLPLDQQDKEAFPLIEYLKKLRQITAGDTEFPQANSKTLIKKLMGNIPSDSNYIVMHKLTDETSLVKSSDQLTQKERSFVIPEFADQVRFFFSFPEIRTDQNVHIEIFKENIKVGDSEKASFQNALHTTQQRRNKTPVFHSFRFYTTNISGSWTIRLTDISKAQTGRLPEIDCLIDIKARLDLEIETSASGEALRAKEPFDFRFKLIGKKKDTFYNIPLTRIDAFLQGRQPENISTYSDKIRTINYDIVSIAPWQGFQEPGTYLLKGWAYFQIDKRNGDPLRLYFEKNYQIKPAVPIEAWFTTQISHERLPEAKLALPAIGEETEVRFSELLIRTSFKGNVSGLTLVAEPLIHNELAISLDESWIVMEPAVLRGLSLSRPLPFSIGVKLPDVIPETIPDGLYRTTIMLKNGVEVLDALEVHVPVIIPRFVQSKEEIDQPFENKSDYPEIIMEKKIYYPGDSPHLFTIPLWSSTGADVNAFPFFIMPQGVEYSAKDTIYTVRPRNQHITFTATADEFTIPGKNSDDPGEVTVEMVLKDDSLNNNSYANTLTLTGEQHRPRTIKLVTHIAFIPKKYIFMGASALVGFSCLLLLRGVTLWRRRSCFEGYEYEGDEDELVIRHGNQRLGTLQKVERHGSSFTTQNTLFFQPTSLYHNQWLPSGREDDDQNWEDIHDNQHPLNINDTLRISTGKKNFQITIDAVPDRLNPEFSYRIEESPYGTGRQMIYYFCSALLLLTSAAWIFIDPYALFRLMHI